jgi:hypothetical protein
LVIAGAGSSGKRHWGGGGVACKAKEKGGAVGLAPIEWGRRANGRSDHRATGCRPIGIARITGISGCTAKAVDQHEVWQSGMESYTTVSREEPTLRKAGPRTGYSDGPVGGHLSSARMAAWAADSMAMGTRYGEQLT